MKRIGIVGEIGSGKSFVAKKFQLPVFDADYVVGKLYKEDKKIFYKLKKILPNYFNKFPIEKNNVTNAILDNKKNLKKIIFIVHTEVKKKLIQFLKKNKNKKIVILDIPLLLENKLNKKGDILVFIQSNRAQILKKLKKRKNINFKLINKFKNIQLPIDYKKKKSNFLIKNDFKKGTVEKYVKYILNNI